MEAEAEVEVDQVVEERLSRNKQKVPSSYYRHMSKTRHSAYNRVAVHVNKRTEHVRLEQTHQNDEVPEWYVRHEVYFEC